MTDSLKCSTCGAGLVTEGVAPPICISCAFGFALEDRSVEPMTSGEGDLVDKHGSAGEMVGPYRLRRVLGEGGMGIVWEAAQDEPVRRRVALKRIRLGMDSSQVLARFESERQALALMSHPNIAQVLDAGRTAEGQPYFAMEYVEGIPLTQYCNERALTVRERLDLFLMVCSAIQHAHQKGVIHRDIKPSNVLVQTEAGRPIPKVIDFGVAKAMGAHLTERTLVTRIGQAIGTPEYMSPEQAGPAGFDVDTRTDVYSLGAVLYELLAGRLPFEATGGDYDDLRRRIREDDPVRPSVRVEGTGIEREEVVRSRAAEAATVRKGADGLSPSQGAGAGLGAAHVARARATGSAALSRALRGDLDWIVMKALAKDRNQRYGTPEELATDLRRHLSSEPVLAGPPSATYRLSKFVRRHRVGVAAATAVLLLLSATAIGMSIQAGRLARERDRANREARTAGAALEFLTDIFRLSDPEQARGETVTAREILDEGAAEIERGLRENPEVQAELTLAIGRSYTNLGLYDRAEPLVRRAWEIRKEVLVPDDPRIHEAAIDLAGVLALRDSLGEAEALARDSLQRLEAGGPEHDQVKAVASLVLGDILYNSAQYEEAESHLRSALDLSTRTLGPDDRRTLEAATYLGRCVSQRGRYDEAGALHRRALEGQRRTLGGDHPAILNTLSHLGINAGSAGRLAEAEAYFREAMDLSRRVLGSDHTLTYSQVYSLGTHLSRMGRFDEAEPLIREAIEGQRRLKGPRSTSTLMGLMALGSLLLNRGDLAEAEIPTREAMEGVRATLGADHPQMMRVSTNLGLILKDQGRLVEAEPHLRLALDGYKERFGPEHPYTLRAMSDMGDLLALRGRHAEALTLLATAVEGLRKALPAKHRDIGTTLRKHGACLTGLGRFEEAEAALVEAHEILLAALGESHPQTQVVVRGLVSLYEAWGRPELVARWRAVAGTST